MQRWIRKFLNLCRKIFPTIPPNLGSLSFETDFPLKVSNFGRTHVKTKVILNRP